MSEVLKAKDITPDEGEAWNAYWATRDQWKHFSDVLPELRAFIAGRRSAAPYIAADAWDEGCQRGWNVGWRRQDLPVRDNPYRRGDDA